MHILLTEKKVVFRVGRGLQSREGGEMLAVGGGLIGEWCHGCGISEW